jgi:tetratricopeptide (TPR) repeat protein
MATAGIVAVIVVLLLSGGVYLYNYMNDVRAIASVLSRTDQDLYGKGDLENALKVYTNALESGEATRSQLASLHGRIGRIHASTGDLDEAIEHYELALGFDPEDRVVKSDYCLALNRLGRHKEAGQCMDGLLAVDPEDEIALTMHRQIEERLALDSDEATSRRIDELIDRLSGRQDSQQGEGLEPTDDAWTSRGMTLAILSFEERGGLSRRAGETEALFNSMLDKLKEPARIRVVDRLLLEKVLEELDLGTGKLADAAFSLRIGRILSARLIGHGSFYRDEESVQVNLRFIETETTSLKVALTETFPRGMKIDEMATRLTDAILSEISAHYPLRGEVVAVEPSGNAILNIGRQVGLEADSLFNVLPPDREDPRLVLARIRVAAVEKDRAMAQILSHPDLVTPGCRVLEATESLK